MSAHLQPRQWQPPAYEHTTKDISKPSEPSASTNLTFVLIGNRIFATDNPSRTLYHLSSDTLSGKHKVISIEKCIYKIKDVEPPRYEDIESAVSLDDDTKGARSTTSSPVKSEGKLSLLDVGSASPLDHAPRVTYHRTEIYTIKKPWMQTIGDTVVLEGARKQSFKSAYLVSLPTQSSWRVCTSNEVWNPGKLADTVEVWKIEKKSGAWTWKSKNKEILSLENNVVSQTNDNNERNMKVVGKVNECEMDLLVSSWVARIAFEAWKMDQEPMSFSKFRRLISNHGSARAPGIYG
ncbi:hypothetical protein BU24DRAFT_426923 [Aaosphaeria arxii CBS 175.79]|uniref:Uncharacterized protein n=1 Tax=Aaosphaeria arxii CBS 175.79 TaxID=1450172 RepID=A0A6A5XCR4_9PLEO|nr:uncharacterized protein BU24DRAFT_426923 [Aaosphaeria arxii CBS 175.79]KAF2010709.1 hypothetical protein BU24DRAFT_426923 [Aaosphaeria arxii CBS 175.79]